MRNELKLAFEELEKELLVIPPDDLLRFMGGFSTGTSSGSSSGLTAGSSLEDVVGYFQDLGFEFTKDSSGNYYFNANNSSGSSSIRLPEVLINGYSSGSNSSGFNYGSGFNGISSGSSGWSNLIDSYVSIFSGYGYSFSGSAGNYSYTPSGGEYQQQFPNPWVRDSLGNIIATKTPDTTSFNYGSDKYTLYFDVVELTSGTTTIKALEVTGVRDNKTNQMMATVPSKFQSNCSGYAFADGKYWIFDSYESDSVNEALDFENMLNDNVFYKKQDSNINSNVAVIWWTDKQTGERFVAHSAKVNGNNLYSQKNDYHDIQPGVSFSQFTAGHIPSDPNLYSYEVIYYKRNF